MKMIKEKYKTIFTPIYLLLLLTFITVSLYGIHSMQTAEGVGLYFHLNYSFDKSTMDVLTDVCAGLSMIVFLVLPALAFRHKSLQGIFHFGCLFYAFMPRLSMAYLIHPAEAKWDHVAQNWELGLQAIIPMSVIFLYIIAKKEKAFKKCYAFLFLACLLLALLLLPFPYLQQLVDFAWTYCLLCVLFDLYERAGQLLENSLLLNFILFGGLVLRVIYQLIIFTSIY